MPEVVLIQEANSVSLDAFQRESPCGVRSLPGPLEDQHLGTLSNNVEASIRRSIIDDNYLQRDVVWAKTQLRVSRIQGARLKRAMTTATLMRGSKVASLLRLTL